MHVCYSSDDSFPPFGFQVDIEIYYFYQYGTMEKRKAIN